MSLIEFDVIDLQKRPAHCYLWADDEQKPTCIVQLSHGMTEHTMRYSDFAKYLCKPRRDADPLWKSAEFVSIQQI